MTLTTIRSGSRGPLAHIRVIDMATTRAELCGRIFADLGAEVIRVEPPGGAAARTMPPFEERPGHGGTSLYWATVGMGKRSIVLDVDQPRDCAQLLALADSADVFIESFDPGTLARYGLDFESLALRNPALVYVSVTPFGQTGPDAMSPSTDLTIEAAGGLISLQGDGDRPPVPVGYPQASFHAGAQAAADAIIALHERDRSGLGQHLDVSMQAAMVWTLMNATGFPPNEGGNPPGTCEHRGEGRPSIVPGAESARLWPCRDGYVSCPISLGAIGGRTMQVLMSWLEEEGALPDGIRGLDWRTWVADVPEGRMPRDTAIAAVRALEEFLLTKTKVKLQTFAAERHIVMAAIYDNADLLADPQLKSREYWTEVDGRIHPGPSAKLSATPITLERGAPALDADRALLGDTSRRPSVLKGAGGERRMSFDGLKVADFAWVGVGPLTSKALADHGATVVHVESSHHIDVLRTAAPFKDGIPGPDRAQFMANYNSSKLGVAINLATEEGRELAWKLIEWADVVVESFTAGVLERHGFDYESIRKRRPDIIMFSTCLRGQTGPERSFAGFGGQGAALAGIHAITGWPDRPPSGPWGAYTDFINPRYAVAALAAAIIHRDRTGEGQHIDQAQVEAGIHFIEPLVLDYTVNGRVARPAGHDSPYACPHGVFATAGDERYIAIACETADHWRKLKAVAPLDAFGDPCFDMLDARIEAKQAIEDALRAWCAGKDAFELAAHLKDAGVPASAVLRPTDLYEDAQLTHRGFFVTLDHPVMGPTPYDGHVTRFSATPGKLRKAAPCLGEDTGYVLRELLGMTDDEITSYAMAGALE